MTPAQRRRLAEALTALTPGEWTDEGHGVHRIAGAHTPPLSVDRADRNNGSACYIADGWDRWLYCARLDGPYVGRGWIDRMARDVAAWCATDRHQPHTAEGLADALTKATGEPWHPTALRMPMETWIVCDRTGATVKLHSDHGSAARLVFPDGRSVTLTYRSGPRMYQWYAADVAALLRPVVSDRDARLRTAFLAILDPGSGACESERSQARRHLQRMSA